MAVRGLTAAEANGDVMDAATMRAADAAGIGATSPAGLVTASTADTVTHAVRLSWADRGNSMDRAATNISILGMTGLLTAGARTAAERANLEGPGFLRTKRSGGRSRASGRRPHPEIALADFIIPSILLAVRHPGRHLTRHVLAVSQILVSIVLIDVTNGRIESHFHVFGSLAILAFYRDWRVLITASAVTAAHHFISGYWWPQSVYGVLTISPWRWVEHAFWVLFEDFFLILMNRTSISEMWTVATREAQLSWGAYFDFLTGLPNRRALHERFEALTNRREAFRGAVMFIDLDRFKQANDTGPHHWG